MNVFHMIRQEVLASLTAMQEAGDLPQGLDFGAIAVEPPRDPAHGHTSQRCGPGLYQPAPSRICLA